MSFVTKIESLKVELESLVMTDSAFIVFIDKSKIMLKQQFGGNHYLVKKLDSITTKPKGAYFPEMIDKENAQALRNCKNDLMEIFNSSVDELKKLIIDQPIDEILKKEESQFLEFKSTLIWDIVNSRPDKKIMGEIIMKSISAFSNSEGGVLLIGVSDGKKILGLNSDYMTFKNGTGNRDDFELHLTSLIINNFSKTFAKDNLSIEFPIIDSKEICLIRIKKGNDPYTIKISDKSGQQKEKFFIRVKNSSRDIDNLMEFARYIKKRFADWN